MTLEGDVPRGDLSLPVEPFASSAIDAALVCRQLLVEPLLQQVAVIVLPVPQDEVHPDVVQTLLGQLGLLSLLGLGLEGVMLAVESVLTSVERGDQL
jgi:hypothetical protein